MKKYDLFEKFDMEKYELLFLYGKKRLSFQLFF